MRHRRRRHRDGPYTITTRAALSAAVEQHKTTRGCPGDSSLYQEPCPCGTKVLIMCATCNTAVVMMVSKGRACAHEMVYHLDDGSTVRPFEGY